MRILFIGDIVGRPGRQATAALLPRLLSEQGPDLIIANAENAAAGLGITEKTADFLFDCGVDVLTTGNHVWAQREALPYVSREPRLLRPANYPPGAPGHGWYVATTAGGEQVAVVNLLGRVFMDPVDCPFRVADALLREALPPGVPVIVDFHAEATSEKQALGRYLDGRVAAVLGTHTHVQTADPVILPGGTAYLSDVGMTGPTESVIGVVTEVSVRRFLTGLPARFEVPRGGPCILSAAVVEYNPQLGRAQDLQRLQLSYSSSSD